MATEQAPAFGEKEIVRQYEQACAHPDSQATARSSLKRWAAATVKSWSTSRPSNASSKGLPRSYHLDPATTQRPRPGAAVIAFAQKSRRSTH